MYVEYGVNHEILDTECLLLMVSSGAGSEIYSQDDFERAVILSYAIIHAFHLVT